MNTWILSPILFAAWLVLVFYVMFSGVGFPKDKPKSRAKLGKSE